MNSSTKVVWAVIESQLRHGEALAKALEASGCSRAQQAEMLRRLVILMRLRKRSWTLSAPRREEFEERLDDLLGRAAGVGIHFEPPALSRRKRGRTAPGEASASRARNG